jgi:hypothetical protein
MRVDTLVETWDQYRVLYAGYRPADPSAILFYPRDGDRGFRADDWREIRDGRRLAHFVSWMQATSYWPPRLWRVLGPQGRFFGYMYTAWDHAVMKAVDETTLYLYDIPFPPDPDEEEPFLFPF